MAAIYLRKHLFDGWKHIDKSEFPENETYSNGIPFSYTDIKTNEKIMYMCVKIEHPLTEPDKVEAYIEELVTKTLKSHLKEYPIGYIDYLSKDIVSAIFAKE